MYDTKGIVDEFLKLKREHSLEPDVTLSAKGTGFQVLGTIYVIMTTALDSTRGWRAGRLTS